MKFDITGQLKRFEKAIKELVADEVLPDIPSEDDPDGNKARWLHMAVPRVKAHLELKGLIPHGF